MKHRIPRRWMLKAVFALTSLLIFSTGLAEDLVIPPAPPGPGEEEITSGDRIEEDSAENSERFSDKWERSLREIDKPIQPGDEVVVLSDAPLKIKDAVVGKVSKGQQLVVEQIQGEWLWVRTGQTGGWLKKDWVLPARLHEWYRSLPEEGIVQVAERGIRAKFKGIWFDFSDDSASIFLGGPRRFILGGHVRTISHPVVVVGNEASFTLQARKSGWLLSVSFSRLGDVGDLAEKIVLGVDSCRPYAEVQAGDSVRIDGRERRVYINGQLVRP